MYQAKKTQIDEIQRRDNDRRQPRSSKGSKSKEGSYLYLADIRILEDKHLFSSVVITLVDEKTRLRKMLNGAGTPQKNKPQLERDISSLNNQIKALKKVAAHFKVRHGSKWSKTFSVSLCDQYDIIIYWMITELLSSNHSL